MILFLFATKTIVTTFGILENFTQEIIKGSKAFKVQSIIKKSDDPHTFVVTPKDYLTLSKADIVIENGLGFEMWLPNMIKNVKFKGKRVVATLGIVPMRYLTNAKIYDPHAWHNIEYAKVYIRNITKALIEEDPANAALYQKNCELYLKKLTHLHTEIKERLSKLNNKKVLTTHDAFWYFGKTYNIEFISPLGISTEEEPSSQQVAKLIEYIRKNKVKAAFFEVHTNNNLVKKIAEETDVTVGGELYADSIKDDYISTMQHNADCIEKAFTA